MAELSARQGARPASQEENSPVRKVLGVVQVCFAHVCLELQLSTPAGGIASVSNMGLFTTR